MKENEPRFIIGLRRAKNILLELKEQKILQQVKQATSINPMDQSPIKDYPSVEQQEGHEHGDAVGSVHTEAVEVNAKQRTIKQRTDQLRVELDKIGRQLFECHNECECFEIIFNRLTEYYRQNMGIIEENQRLKRKSFELRQYIADYRKKIEQNQKKIEQIAQQEEDARRVVKEELWKYLITEHQKGMQEALPPLRVTHDPKKLRKVESPVEEEVEPTINLRFGALKKMSVRKGVLRRAPSQQQQMRRPFFQAELYTL